MFSRVRPIPLFDFVASLSRVMDLMNTSVVDHHMRVACISLNIAQEMKYPAERVRSLIIAAVLHDIGAFYFQERLDLLQFETTAPHRHGKAGYLLLKDLEPFAVPARIIRFHHVPWAHGGGARFEGDSVPMDSHVIHLADRIAVSIQKGVTPLAQIDAIYLRILQGLGSRFVPEMVEAFERLAKKDAFWLQAVSDAPEALLRRAVRFDSLSLTLEQLVDLARLICRIIDFKSEFTATHSSGVAAAAVALARKVGFSRREQQLMQVAAYLHDLGKLAVPAEILEKQDKLSHEEWQIMRGHVYYTYEILSQVEGFDIIDEWGSLHQERLNGSGYPFRVHGEDLSLGARIMAVADVFTGITEDRPYRKGMTEEEARGVLQAMADGGELDARLVGMVTEEYARFDACRAEAQKAARAEYEEFARALA